MSVAVVKSQLQNCTLLTQSRNVCASAVCLFLTAKGLTIITRVCRMDFENSGGVLFVLMSRIPDSVLLSAVTITRGKLPESVVIKCDAPVLNDPLRVAPQACLTSKTLPRCVCWHSWGWRWNSRRSPSTPCSRSCRSEPTKLRLLSLTVRSLGCTHYEVNSSLAFALAPV